MSNQSITTVHILQPAESALMHNTICDDEHVQGFQQDKWSQIYKYFQIIMHPFSTPTNCAVQKQLANVISKCVTGKSNSIYETTILVLEPFAPFSCPLSMQTSCTDHFLIGQLPSPVAGEKLRTRGTGFGQARCTSCHHTNSVRSAEWKNKVLEKTVRNAQRWRMHGNPERNTANIA